MFDLNSHSDLLLQCKAVTEDEPDLIANLANISAIIFDGMADINWAGFYFSRSDDELVLGPFQGKVACVRIAFGKGVCGVAAATKQLQHVDDVHQFSGHIACDAASNSEVVAPIIVNEKVVAVLDIDSPKIARFSEQDAAQIVAIAEYCQQLDWSQL